MIRMLSASPNKRSGCATGRWFNGNSPENSGVGERRCPSGLLRPAHDLDPAPNLRRWLRRSKGSRARSRSRAGVEAREGACAPRTSGFIHFMISSFIWKMAWRDSRSSRRRLLLFSISITLGIAALVAIGSFRHSLSQAIDEQARSLIGADLVVDSTRPFSPEAEAFLHSLGEPQAREVRFSSMATFPRSDSTRLAHVRALGGDFPFYGVMETVPAAAARDFRDGGRALVDQSLLLQFHAQVGDPIKIGDVDFTIAGALTKMPGEASAAGSFAPRVYIPLQDLAATNLLKPGSIARYRDYVKFPDGTDVAKRIEILTPQIQRLGWD